MSPFADRLQLIVAGIGFAFAAWAYFHYLQNDAWLGLMLILNLALLLENRVLRRRLVGMSAKSRDGLQLLDSQGSDK